MAFNVKDEEVIRLADELAERLHLSSRIDAIRHALKAQIEVTHARAGNRSDELLDVLQNEIWPLLSDSSSITKAEREQVLGYDPATGSSEQMIIDTSAIIAMIQREDPHAEHVVAALAGDRSPAMAAPSIVECLIVLTSRHGTVARTVFDRLRSEINLGVVVFTADHAAAAHRAYTLYGKGRHPAALNFGDTMAYAAAKLSHEPLIAVGNDFAQTDLEFDGVIGYWPNPTINQPFGPA